MHVPLSACLIVRDEELCIGSCLESVKGRVDEILVVDTGSADRTLELAGQYADRLLHYNWVNDFSAARNFSIKSASNDWVLIIDADNTIIQWEEQAISTFLREQSAETTGSVQIINTYDGFSGESRCVDWETKIFNRRFYRYTGLIHEQVTPLEGKAAASVGLPISFTHYGYKNDALAKKTVRNISMLQAALSKQGENCYLYYQLGKSYELQKDYTHARGYYARAMELIDNPEHVYVRKLVIAYGYTLIQQQQYKNAAELEKYFDLYSRSPDYCFMLGYISMMNARFQRAIELFSRCTTLQNGEVEGITSWLPLYNIGVIYECLGQKEQAKAFYYRCVGYKNAQNRIAALT